jgi:hypothetical protein
MRHHLPQKPRERPGGWHCLHPSGEIKSADLAYLCVAPQFPQQRLYGGMLEDNPGDQHIPYRSSGEIVAAPITVLFELFHERFVAQIFQNQSQYYFSPILIKKYKPD